jgi:pantetheine-phosphate adenylyltransferase
MKKCLYTGSFDPFHNGHLHLVERASKMFDHVTVLLASNPSKKYLLDREVAQKMIRKSLFNSPEIHSWHVDILPSHMLAADYAKQHGIKTIIKGIRNVQDTEYEKMLHEITVSQEHGVDTAVLFAGPEDHKISSSAVKELVKFHGDVREYVPLWTKQAMEVAQNKYIYGITGTIGSGKSTITHSLVNAGIGCPYVLKVSSPNPKFYNVDLDQLAKDVLYPAEPSLELLEIHKQIEDILKVKVRDEDGNYNFKRIGKKFFWAETDGVRREVNQVIKPVLVKAIRHELAKKKEGVFFLNGALLIDLDLTWLCNNNLTVLQVPDRTIKRRLMVRYKSEEEVYHRMKSQLSTSDKITKVLEFIKRDNHGMLNVLDNADVNKDWGCDEQLGFIDDVLHPALTMNNDLTG